MGDFMAGDKKDSVEDIRESNGRFAQGNSLWKLAENAGKPRLFATPEDLWKAAVKYFQWAEDNPLVEEKIFHSQGEITKDTVTHPRTFTLAGFYVHANITEASWYDYKRRPEYSWVIERIQKAMFEQKFSGAASGFFNATIIARDLGLKEQQEIDQNVKSDVTVKADVKQITAEMDAKTATELYQDMMKGD